MSKTFQGSCHCGAVKFEATASLDKGINACTCSICHKLNFQCIFDCPFDSLKIISGKDDLQDYQFGAKKIHWWFCKHCGVHPYVTGHIPQRGGDVLTINASCIDDVELAGTKMEAQLVGEYTWEWRGRDYLANHVLELFSNMTFTYTETLMYTYDSETDSLNGSWYLLDLSNHEHNSKYNLLSLSTTHTFVQKNPNANIFETPLRIILNITEKGRHEWHDDTQVAPEPPSHSLLISSRIEAVPVVVVPRKECVKVFYDGKLIKNTEPGLFSLLCSNYNVRTDG